MNRKFNKQKKHHIRTGDLVKVITGKSKGKTGKILRMISQKDRAVVEGLNIVTKHVKPSANKPEGGQLKVEASIHVSNLMIVDPKTGEVTRVGRKLVDGKMNRYSKKSGQIIKNNG